MKNPSLFIKKFHKNDKIFFIPLFRTPDFVALRALPGRIRSR